MTPAVAQDVLWGLTSDTNAVAFRGVKYQTTARSTTAERYSAGGQIDRVGQSTYTKMRLGQFPAGLQPYIGVQPYTSGLISYIENPGLQTRQKGPPVLPYLLTTQTSVTDDESIASSVAANLRRHDVFTSAGSASGPRLLSFMVKKMYRPVSTSSRVQEVAHTFTNNVTAVVAAPTNNTPGVIVATDGTTDDILYTDNPTSTPVVFSTWKALTSGDYIWGLTYFPTSPGKPFIKIGGVLDGVNGTFYALTNVAAPVTPGYLVVSADKDVEGSLPPVTGTAIYGQDLALTVGNPTITDSTNIAADDGSYATLAWAGAGGSVEFLVTGLVGPSGAARSARLTGFLIEIQCKESNADDGIVLDDVQIYLDGSATGPAFKLSNNGAEIATSDTTYSVGTSTNNLGLGLTMADIDRMGLYFSFRDLAGTTPSLTIDFIRITPTYRAPGDLIAYGKGGWGMGRSPFNEQMDAWVAPEIDEQSTITATRVLYVGEYEWDNNGDRPVYTRSRPNTGVGQSVWHAAWYLGFLAVTTAPSSGPGTTLKFIAADGAPRDLNMAGYHATQQVKINTLYVQADWLIMEWIYYDSGASVVDRQWVYWRNQAYYPDTLKQSLSQTGIAAAPIPSSTALIDTKQNCIYSFWPNGSDTAVTRTFLQGDLSQDPRAPQFAAEIRSMGWSAGTETVTLKLTLPEMDFGPEEALKAIVQVRMQNRRVSANNSTFGTTAFEADITGDTTLASAAISTTFSTGLGSATGTYRVPSAGVAYITILPRIGCAHEAGTAKSPDCGYFLITAVMDWPTERRFFIILAFDDESNDADNLPMLLDRMFTLQRTKLVQPLTVGENTVAAVFKGPTFVNGSVLIPEYNSTETPEENEYPKEGIAFEFFEVYEGSAT